VRLNDVALIRIIEACIWFMLFWSWWALNKGTTTVKNSKHFTSGTVATCYMVPIQKRENDYIFVYYIK